MEAIQALVIKIQPNILVQAKNRAAMEAAWNDDARIEKMIYELNFGAFSKERLV